MFQELSGRLIQGYGLIFAALGVPEVDKAPVKVNVIPLQPEQSRPASCR